MLQTSVAIFEHRGQRIYCKARGMPSRGRCFLVRTGLCWTGLHDCYAVFVRMSP